MESLDGTTVLAAAAILLAILILLVVGIGILRGPGAFYVRRDELLSLEESDFLALLEAAMGNDYRIFPKVGALALIDLKRRMSHRTRQLAWSRIAGEQFDFVLADKTSLAPVAVLLLTDSPAVRRSRRRLGRLRKICATLKLPLIELALAETPSVPGPLGRYIELQLAEPAPEKSSVRKEPQLESEQVVG